MERKTVIKLFWICLGAQAVFLFSWIFICFYQRRFFPDVGDENYRFILLSLSWADVFAFFVISIFTVLFVRQLHKRSSSIACEIAVFVLFNFILMWVLNKAAAFAVRIMATMGGMPAVACIDKLNAMKIWLLQLDPRILFYMILGMSIYCKRRSEDRPCLWMALYLTVGFQCMNLLANILLYLYKEPLTTIYGLMGDTFNPPPVIVYLLPDIICLSVQLACLLLFLMQLRQKRFSILPEILGSLLLHSLSLWVPIVLQTWIGRLGGYSMLVWYSVLEKVKHDINPMEGVATGIFFIACGITISMKMSGRKGEESISEEGEEA